MPKYHFFWNDGYFSQWVHSPMVVNRINFVNCEQYMMYSKAVLFNDMTSAENILKTENPKEIKAMGRLVKGFNNEIWNKNKYDIVYKGNLEKFKQNEKFKQKLLSMSDVEFVEASPYDKIWGIGMGEEEKGIEDKNNWKGENLLGEIITKVRDELTKETH